jgi:alpha,alpha-trehalase
MHDRGVRESGHDTSYRLDRKCADLATVDLNSLLYKYESDIATAIEQVFGDELELDDEFDLTPWPITAEAYAPGAPRERSTSRKQTSAEWKARLEKRKEAMNELCWNEGQGMYFDYDCKAEKQTRYESVTTLFPLWAGCASEAQAFRLVDSALPKFEVAGGLVSGTEESRGIISLDRPNRQWGELSVVGRGASADIQTTHSLGHRIRSWRGSGWSGTGSTCTLLDWLIDGSTCELIGS